MNEALIARVMGAYISLPRYPWQGEGPGADRGNGDQGEGVAHTALCTSPCLHIPLSHIDRHGEGVTERAAMQGLTGVEGGSCIVMQVTRGNECRSCNRVHEHIEDSVNIGLGYWQYRFPMVRFTGQQTAMARVMAQYAKGTGNRYGYASL